MQTHPCVSFPDMSHTILLLQSTSKLDSRTYSDYESVDECLDGTDDLSFRHALRTTLRLSLQVSARSLRNI